MLNDLRILSLMRRLLNSCVYGQLFPDASDIEIDSLRTLGNRWKQYEKEGKWKYEAHPFWCTGYTFVSNLLRTGEEFAC